jgi:2'-5' RNA ligase
MAETSIRSFIAIELPQDVTRGLDGVVARLRTQLTGPELKWVPATGIHLTLKFLGETPARMIDDVQRILQLTCGGCAPLQLSIGGLGVFPSARSPRVVWAGLEGDTEALKNLAMRIDAALGTVGFERETRPFTPHLTLARVREDVSQSARATIGAIVTQTAIQERLSFGAEGVSLMRSQLTPRGALYSRLAYEPFTRQRTQECPGGQGLPPN